MADVRKPTVLLVDDDVGILKAIHRIIAPEFEVVATVTNGLEAVDHVSRFDPDIVVLDISMPGLNGFETAAELRRIGSLAKLLFLTSHRNDGYVNEAIESGASGYVLKQSAWSTLMPALHHVLAGRQFLPDLALLAQRRRHAHTFHTHPDTNVWLDGVAHVLSEALHDGDVAAVALTPDHRDDLAVRLAQRHWNLADLETLGRYLVFDIDDASRRVIRNGRLDRDAVAEMIDALDRARGTCVGGPASRLVIVGEISVLLCRNGNFEAALDLEQLWDELTQPLPILTVCAYPEEWRDQSVPPDLMSAVWTHHGVVTHASE